MSSEIVDRLRDLDLAVKLWGYDREQVDALLADLDRLAREESGESAGAELAGVGERVEAILAAAAEAADHVREEASRKAAELTRESRESSEAVRTEAEEYAGRLRAEADREAEDRRRRSGSEAEEALAAAEQEADQIVRDAMMERRRIEDSISDLRERRELVIQSIERLRGSLGSMVGEAELGGELAAEVDDGDSEIFDLEQTEEAEGAEGGGEELETTEEAVVETETYEVEGDGADRPAG